MLFNSKILREKIAEKQAEAEAIISLAETEEREVTAEELKAFSAIAGHSKAGDPGYVAGQIQDLENKLDLAIKREKIQANILHGKVNTGEVVIADEVTPDNGPESFATKVRVPANCRSRRELKAFTGDNAEKEAFLTGHFLAAQLGGSKRSQEYLDSIGFELGMNESDSSRGGIFVPVETEYAIIRQVERHGVIRGEARMTNMSSDRKVETVRVSGISATPVGETEAIADTDPTYKQIELIARKWKVQTKISDDLNEDSLISMADEFTVEAGLAFAIAEDNSGFNGDGTSAFHKVTGIFNALNAGSILEASAKTFAALKMADFLSLVGMLPDYPGLMPKWYISKAGYYASMAQLEAAAGGNQAAQLVDGFQNLTFLGFPVRWSHVLNRTLTSQDSTKLLTFGDMKETAVFGDRRGITMNTTDERYWDTDQIGVKGTERFDFNVYSPGTATEAGAMIALETPA